MKEIAGPELTIPYHLAICVSERVGSRGGSAGMRNLYSYITSSGDIRYDNRSYAAVVGRPLVAQARDVLGELPRLLAFSPHNFISSVNS